MADICVSPIRRSGRAGRRHDYLVLLLILLAALAHPLAVRLLYNYSSVLAIYLPTIFFVFAICLICPHPVVPVCVLMGLFAVQLPPIIMGGNSDFPNLFDKIMMGKFHLIGVPVAAMFLGFAAISARRRMTLCHWSMKSNLRILAYKPWLFIRVYRWPLIILLIGALLDTITTMNSMSLYGTDDELHPGIRVMVEQYGITFGMPIGTIVRLGFVLFVAAIWRRWCWWVLTICGILYILAAMSNHFLWL